MESFLSYSTLSIHLAMILSISFNAPVRLPSLESVLSYSTLNKDLVTCDL